MESWKNIRLELGCTPEFPHGSVSRGYLLHLPLGPDGAVDGDAVQRRPHLAMVRRYWSTEPDEFGELLRVDGKWALGSNGKRRLLDLDGQPLRRGDRLSIADPDGTTLPFTIASIR